MYDMKTAEPIVKYDILTTWLVERLENNETINEKELERLLSSLDIFVEHKCQEIRNADEELKGE